MSLDGKNLSPQIHLMLQKRKRENIAYFDYQICLEELVMATIINRYHDNRKLPAEEEILRVLIFDRQYALPMILALLVRVGMMSFY